MRGELKLVISLFGILLIIAPVLNTQSSMVSETNIFQEYDIAITDFRGGFFTLKFDVKNNGENTIETLNWNISVEGGGLGLVNSKSNGVIQSLPAGETTEIRSNLLFGIGKIIIKVEIENYVKSYKGSIFLFYNTINPGFTIGLENIAKGLNSPTSMSYPIDDSDRIFITDQIGKIYVIKDSQLLEDPFLDISNKMVDLDNIYDERGLLGLAFHPDYVNNGLFYIYYSAPTKNSDINHESILAEYQVSTNNPDLANKESERIILKIDEPEANHNGGQLVFGPDNYLYIGVGDGGGAGDQHGEIGNGQNKSNFLGSILRIDVNEGQPYDIPDDNPFVGSEGLDEIYAYGLRNPWRFSFDFQTGRFFVADVGQDEWEEINIVQKGGNYGWRIMESNHIYDQDLANKLGIDIEDLEKPIHEYSHSVGRSITGGYLYRGNEIPELEGRYVFGDWSTSFTFPNGKLYYIEETEQDKWSRFNIETRQNFNNFILSLGEDKDGELYILSKTNLGPSGSSGVVDKIVK